MSTKVEILFSFSVVRYESREVLEDFHDEVDRAKKAVKKLECLDEMILMQISGFYEDLMAVSWDSKVFFFFGFHRILCWFHGI